MQQERIPRKPAAEVAAKVPGLSEAQVQDHYDQVDSQNEAGAVALPGPLADAFPIRRIAVAGVHVRPIVAADYPILQALNAPIYRQMIEAAKPAAERQNTAYSDQEGYDMIFQFTRPVEEVEQILALGVDHFHQVAKKEIGYRMSLPISNLVASAINDMISDSFNTAISYGGEKEGETFTKPPAGRKTASAGGLTTSAGSSPATQA